MPGLAALWQEERRGAATQLMESNGGYGKKRKPGQSDARSGFLCYSSVTIYESPR